MSQQWQLHDAKNRFNEVVENAIQEGPQVITKRGKEAVIIVSIEDYCKLTSPSNSLIEFFHQSPLYDMELDLERNQDFSREGSRRGK